MSRGMVSFLTGLGGGYLKADQQRSQNERQAKQDAQNTQLHDARMLEITAAQNARTEESTFKAANIAAQSGGRQETGYQVTDNAGSSAFTKDADAAAMLGDMAAAKNTGVDTLAATRVSTGAQGATMAGTVAGNKVFTDPTQAASFAQDNAMSSWMKMKSRQDVADQFGKMDLSDDIRGKLQKLESEGAFKAFALAQNGDYAGAAKMYQDTGSSRLPKGATFTGAEVEDPTTKLKRNVISVIGADGAPIVQDLDKALRSYLSPTEQYTMNSGDRKEVQDGRKTDIAEKRADIAARAQEANERKIDGMLAHLGSKSGSGGGGIAGSVALKDRREYLSDFSGALPDPKNAQDPKEAIAIATSNQNILAQADSVFSTNAKLGIVLTAPQAAAAMTLAQTPSNIKRVRDNNTGAVYESVTVNGTSVIVGIGSMKPTEKKEVVAPPKTDAKAPKPGVTMTGVASKFNAAGYTTVQSTIDGAVRGDKNALALLKVMITRGETTPGQRQQISDLTK